MARKFLCFATFAIAFSLLSPPADAQGRFDFDGVADNDPQPADPTDWMTTENWSEGGADPFGPPFGPLVPDFNTRVEIVTSTFGVDAPVIGPGDVAEAFGVRIGRSDGAGLLTMTGGTLDIVDNCSVSPFSCGRRLRMGNDDANNVNPGTFDLSDGTVNTDTLWIGSGSKGTMNMSGGVVNARGEFSLDWSFDAGSELNVTGGTINIGSSLFSTTRALRMYRNSVLNLDGGEIFIEGFAGLGYTDGSITQTPNVTVNIDSGLLQADSFLRVEGLVTIDGGVLRADSFNETLSTGTVEVNSSGLLQFNNAQESVAAVEALISGGVITTSGASPLIVGIVDINGTDFTQVSAVAAGVPGDYNGNGTVDAADYTLWLDTLGSAGAGLAADGDGNNVVNQLDYTYWKTRFGNIAGSTTGSAVATNLPEPSSFALILLAVVGFVSRCRNFVDR